ncbi:DUF3784 domain-containing protein [Halopenitus persicus]|uniref:DUF3784 domain-containing protein n=1 Tax=Halopenitus persicus TaxID=1048396 RepID=A0A1H3NBC1_9EURY|nr:DUF3784 domain-containing protein [Halopenitus persicus]SDY86197.1 protein of unknown function [Halopenitus persicus]
MTEQAVTAIGAGIFIGILGILIKYVGVMDLIAGYDPETVTDEEGLADFVGTNALYVAALTICVGILELRSSAADSEWYWLVFVVAIAAIAIRMVRGARRFESTSERDKTS